MNSPHLHLDPGTPADRDRVESAEGLRWRNFYADRNRPCPFFGAGPDENLAEWIEGGRLQPAEALDIGCGNGRNLLYLARNGFAATGVDVSEPAIAWARERATACREPVRLVCGSIFDNTPAPRSLGLIYDSGCFHHLAPHQRRPYAELVAAALRPQAHFGLVCFAPDGGSGYTDEQVYERGSLGGGLGYTGAVLREFWSRYLEVIELRRMHDMPADSGWFGKPFLWVLLARAR